MINLFGDYIVSVTMSPASKPTLSVSHRVSACLCEGHNVTNIYLASNNAKPQARTF